MNSAAFALGRAEWKLLLRNKTVAFSALLMPLMLGAVMSLTTPGDVHGWSMTLAMQMLAVLGLTVYFTATAALASRREDLYLKRLRSGEVSVATILTGLLAPVVLLGAAQVLVVFGIAVGLGAPLPANPLPLLAALLLGAGMCIAAGAATSGLTSTSEQAQITTLPGFLLLIGGALLAPLNNFAPPVLLLPGGGFADLVSRSMTGGDLLGSLPALGSLLAWTLLLTLLARAYFRWEPRK